MGKQHFDYSKTNSFQKAYYGFHFTHGRLHIDTKRLKKLGFAEVFPRELFTAPRNVHYFVPKYKNKNEYPVNILKSCIKNLKKLRYEEYLFVITKLKTPSEVYENSRIEQLSMTSCSDDYDEIEISARLDGFLREKKYYEVIKSISLQFLQRIFIEYFRSLLLVIKERGHENKNDFSYKDLIIYVSQKIRHPKKVNPLFTLENYKYLEALNKIDNFLKHNTILSYLQLADNPNEKDPEIKEFLSTFVYTKEEKGISYENGMYSGDWLKLKEKFIEDILDKLELFSEEFCVLLYHENLDEAKWNSDESLIDILENEILYYVMF